MAMCGPISSPAGRWEINLVTKGHYSVAEGYVEAVVPIMKGMDASGAIRYTATALRAASILGKSA